MFIEKTKRGEVIYDVPSRLLKDRVIFLDTEVNEESSSNIISLLHLLNKENQEKPIDFWIDSPGGTIDGLFSICDMIDFISAPVKTICVGSAYSAAAVLLSCGAKGQRFLMPNSTVMIHQIRNHGGISGTGTEIKIEAKRIQYLKKKINLLLAETTGQPVEKIEKDTENDKYFNAESAIKYGLADKILRKPKPKEVKISEQVPEKKNSSTTK